MGIRTGDLKEQLKVSYFTIKGLMEQGEGTGLLCSRRVKSEKYYFIDLDKVDEMKEKE